jgi:hypothetical protein
LVAICSDDTPAPLKTLQKSEREAEITYIKTDESRNNFFFAFFEVGLFKTLGLWTKETKEFVCWRLLSLSMWKESEQKRTT